MRRSRLALSLTLVVAALVGLGVALTASGSATRSQRALAPASVHPPKALIRQLGRYLAGRPPSTLPRVVVPRNLPPPGPTVCFAAGGNCSLTPCIEFARGGIQGVSTSSTVIVLRTPVVPASRGPGGAVPGSSCPGHRGTPQVLRVARP